MAHEGTGHRLGPAVADGKLFVGTEDNTPFPGGIAAIDPATGNRLWYKNDGAFYTPLTLANGVIYSIELGIDLPSKLRMVDEATGSVIADHFCATDFFTECATVGVTVVSGMVLVADGSAPMLEALTVGSGAGP